MHASPRPWKILAAATALALAGCAQPAPEAPAEVRPLDGEGFQELLREARGQPLMVNFWATWCDPCREEFPALEALSRDLGRRVRVVAVSVDSPRRLDRVREFLADLRVSFPQYIRADSDDEAFINAVDPEWTGAVPATFLYDGSGSRAGLLVGQQTRESLEAALRPLLAE